MRTTPAVCELDGPIITGPIISKILLGMEINHLVGKLTRNSLIIDLTHDLTRIRGEQQRLCMNAAARWA
jgi:hypothetical protein